MRWLVSASQAAVPSSSRTRRACPAQAARPKAGGSRAQVRNQAAIQHPLGRCAQRTPRRHGRAQTQSQSHTQFGRFRLLSTCSRVSIKFMARSLNVVPQTASPKSCGLTLPSSGQLPAWPFQARRFMVRLPGPSRQLPLMSNVRRRKSIERQFRVK